MKPLRKTVPALLLALLLVTAACRVGEVQSPSPTAIPQQTWGTQKSRELLCLAKNIYFESRGEPFHGKVAVAQVTLNRVNHETEFKSTVCGVVYQNKQFSWTLDKTRVRDHKAWDESLKIAHAVMEGTLRIPNFNALYFHTKQVRPSWRKTKKIVKTIGNHIFYA